MGRFNFTESMARTIAEFDNLPEASKEDYFRMKEKRQAMTDTPTPDLTAPDAVMLSAATCLLLDGRFVQEADYRALSAKLEAAEAERDAALGVLQEMRDDKVGFRNAVHFRRRAAAFLAARQKGGEG